MISVIAIFSAVYSTQVQNILAKLCFDYFVSEKKFTRNSQIYKSVSDNSLKN